MQLEHIETKRFIVICAVSVLCITVLCITVVYGESKFQVPKLEGIETRPV